MEFAIIRMEIYILVNGKVMIYKDKEFIYLKMERNIRANSKKV